MVRKSVHSERHEPVGKDSEPSLQEDGPQVVDNVASEGSAAKVFAVSNEF